MRSTELHDRYRVIARSAPGRGYAVGLLSTHGGLHPTPEALLNCLGACVVRTFARTPTGYDFEVAISRPSLESTVEDLDDACQRLGLRATEILITQMLKGPAAAVIGGVLGTLGISAATRNAAARASSGVVAAAGARALVEHVAIPIGRIRAQRSAEDGSWTYRRAALWSPLEPTD